MKACPQYAEEMAACAATGETPVATLAAHLQSCACCRDALNELRRVAAINVRLAGGLTEPLKAISLPSVFLNSTDRPRFLKPVFWLAAAAAACLAIFIALPESQKRHDRTLSFVEPPREETSWEPTWQRLREGVDTFPASQGGGSVVAHYRVKDAYSDLN